MRFQRLQTRKHATPASELAASDTPSLPRRVVRHASGGLLGAIGDTLADVVPTISVPYIAVQQASGPNLRGIDQKMLTKSEENLATLAQETDKVWNEKMKSLDILPVYQKKLSEYRDNYLQNVQQRVRADGSFLSSTANRLQLQQSFLAALDSPEIRTMSQNSKEFEKWWEEKKANHKEDDQFYVNGKRAGMTNADYYRTLRNSKEKDAEALLEGFGSAGRPLGTMQLNTRIGSFAKHASKEIDDISGLAQASTTGGSNKTFDINSFNSEALGSTSAQVYSHLRSSNVKTNGQALAAMASYYGDQWRSRLSKEAVEGLEDQYDNEFTQKGRYPFVVQRADGQILQPNTESVQALEQAARAGQLKNPGEVLAGIEQQRQRYVDQQASNYIKTRIMGRLQQDSETKSEDNLDSRGAALTDVEKASAATEGDFEKNADMRNVSGTTIDTPSPSGVGSTSWYQIAHDVQTKENRDKQFVGQTLDLMSGRQLGMFGRPNNDLTGQLVGTDEMRIFATKGEAAQNVATSPLVLKLDNDISKAEQQLRTFTPGKAKPAEIAALSAQIAQMKERKYDLIEAGKTALQHVVRVAVPKKVAARNPLLTQWRDENQQPQDLMSRGMTAPWDNIDGVFSNGEVDRNKLGAANAYGAEFRKLTPDEAKKAGVPLGSDGNSAEEYLLYDMLVQSQTQDLLNDSKWKGRERFMGQQGVNARNGEVLQVTQDATWLTQFTNPFTAPTK